MMPHPFVSCGTSEDEREGVRRFVEERVRPIFNKSLNSPQETFSDSMAILYRPNNFRVQSSLLGLSDSTLKDLRECYRAGGKGLCFIRLGRVTLQLGRSKLTAIWDQRENGQKVVYRLSGSVGEVTDGILKVKDRIFDELSGALRGFALKHGLSLGPVVWERAEESIKGDEYIDAIPRDVIIHDVLFKKVYAEDLEFTTRKGGEPSVTVRNYVHNRAVERVAPEIARELAVIRSLLPAPEPDYDAQIEEILKGIEQDWSAWAGFVLSRRERVEALPADVRPRVMEKIWNKI